MENQRKERTVYELAAENNALRAENETLNAENKTLNAEIETLNAENERLQQQVDMLIAIQQKNSWLDISGKM